MPFKTLKDFIAVETSGGVVLFTAALIAIIFDNSPLSFYYEALFSLPVTFQLGILEISKPFLLWVNDGLMTIFFLLVGLEIKREILAGELNTAKKCALPGIAAIGGIAIPALVYLFFNHGDAVAMRGWAIPTATDIAFSLGILAMLGSRIPVSLKIFLTAVAIFDDIAAIVVIAVFYTEHVSIILLIVASLLSILLFVFNYLGIMRIGPYVFVGVFIWLCVLKSGVHATLAGIIIALSIPLRDPENPRASPLRRVESKLHPWVAFGVLPIFAFANAGVSFSGMSWAELINPITVGIALGLFIGKQIGVLGTSWLGLKAGFIHRPSDLSLAGIYGAGLIAGVGFTMSLFIGSLAFGALGEHYPAMVRLGVIVGSLLSGVVGYLVLRYAYPLRR